MDRRFSPSFLFDFIAVSKANESKIPDWFLSIPLDNRQYETPQGCNQGDGCERR